MIMFKAKSDLIGTRWAVEDVFTLQRMLTDEEFEENITDNMGDMQRLKVCSKILNEREALPARYKELVKDWKKNDIQIPEVIY